MHLIMVDGGPDLAANEPAVTAKYLWIPLLCCDAHIGLLTMKDIGKLPLVTSLVEQVIDTQIWFSANGKVSAILASGCRKYGQTKSFCRCQTHML